MNAKQLHIASDMLRLRDSMRSLYGERWAKVSAPWQELIRIKMEEDGNDNPLSAVIPLAKALDRAGESPLVCMASAVELAEFK